jgi:hypothetical protein
VEKQGRFCGYRLEPVPNTRRNLHKQWVILLKIDVLKKVTRLGVFPCVIEN